MPTWPPATCQSAPRPTRLERKTAAGLLPLMSYVPLMPYVPYAPVPRHSQTPAPPVLTHSDPGRDGLQACFAAAADADAGAGAGADAASLPQAACDELGGRLGPRLNQAAAAGDMDGVRRVQADAEAMVAELDAVTDQLVKAQHARGSSGMEGMEGLAEAGRKRAGRGRGRGRGKSAEQRAGSGLADEPGRHVDGTAGGAAGSMGAGPEWQWWLRASALDAHALVATACEVLGAREELLASLERYGPAVHAAVQALVHTPQQLHPRLGLSVYKFNLDIYKPAVIHMPSSFHCRHPHAFIGLGVQAAGHRSASGTGL